MKRLQKLPSPDSGSTKQSALWWIGLIVIAALVVGAMPAFYDPTFIQWKPSARYWLFSLALMGSKTIFRFDVIKCLLETLFRVPDSIWSRLNLACVLFFILLGLLNLYVAYNCTQHTWVNFKLFGCPALMFAFVLAVWLYLHLSKHPIEDQADG